jgi:hypothetical protein
MAAAASFSILKKPIAPANDGVAVFIAPDGQLALDVMIDAETVWLNQRQLADLFGTSTPNIIQHINTIYAEKELTPTATTKDYLAVQTEGNRRVERKIKHYNLDAVISVGYRINSKRGTQFRIWATKTLRDHLLKGVTLNERRLAQRGLSDMQATIDLLAGTLTQRNLLGDEGAAVLDVVSRYARSWQLLLEYDEDRLPGSPVNAIKPKKSLTPASARAAIASLKRSLAATGQATPLFGLERDAALERILPAIEQTFDRTPLYPTVQSRAAHLLYFIIKDHPFTDGNKRIASRRTTAPSARGACAHIVRTNRKPSP